LERFEPEHFTGGKMIFGRHSVLKRGSSTWDEQKMPRDEFRARLDTVRNEMARQDLDALVIYGDNYSFADLCYLTNYFPKVRGGIVVVPRSGPISLLLNIGSRDVPFAKSLTWVEDVRASGQVGRDGAALLQEKGLAQARIGLADSGMGFPLPQLEEMKSALPEAKWYASDSLVQRLRLRKSPRELAALGEAGHVLSRLCNEAGGFIRQGRQEYEIVADIDRLARNMGVEDIRILVGDQRLQPPGAKMTGKVGDHWAVYLAIQHERYWVEAGRTYILSADAKLQSAYERAQQIVGNMARQLKPGGSVAAIDVIAREQLGEFYAAASVYGFGNGIGLNQWEAPFLSDGEARQMGAATSDSPSLEQDMILALRVVLETEGKLILFGSTYHVTSEGPKSLIGN
jgi:Xaa-Pro aminopeptidase